MKISKISLVTAKMYLEIQKLVKSWTFIKSAVSKTTKHHKRRNEKLSGDKCNRLEQSWVMDDDKI